MCISRIPPRCPQVAQYGDPDIVHMGDPGPHLRLGHANLVADPPDGLHPVASRRDRHLVSPAGVKVVVTLRPGPDRARREVSLTSAHLDHAELGSYRAS